MSSFQFNAKSQKVNQLCQQTIDILKNRTEDEVKKLVDNFQDFWEEYQQQKKLSIAFIGDVSNGKTTYKIIIPDSVQKVATYQVFADSKDNLEIDLCVQ
ncbi:MAG: hypothetical protein ACKPCI_15205 [Dolichospermum sp.]